MVSRKRSCEPSARPPETTILAPPSSGRSDLVMRFSRKVDRPGSRAAEPVSIGAEPPASAGAKAAVRTVSTTFGSLDCTVCTALPA